MRQKKQEENYTWSKTHHSIFESFAVGLEEFWQGGDLPRYSGKLLRNSLEKQKKSMAKKGLQMTYDFKPNGNLAETPVRRGWRDEIYTNELECRTCQMTRKIYKNGEEIYKDKTNVEFSQIITNIQKGTMIAEEHMSCPKCGAFSTVRQLEEKCPYCGTVFHITDIFPNVSNYYMIREVGGTEEEFNCKRRIVQIIAILVFMAVLSVEKFLIQKPDESMATILIDILVGSVLGGLIFGYAIFVLSLMGVAFKEAGKSLPVAFATVGSKRRFENTVRQYCPDFSAIYFRDKVVAILRQLLSEPDITRNPYYVGPPVNLDADNIVEFSYRGGMGIKKCHVQDGHCTVLVEIYMTNYYYKEEKIKKKNEKIQMTLEKNLQKNLNLHFSLDAITCKGCGGSFDAAKTRECPYCGRPYEIGDDDWVVSQIRINTV